MANFRLTLISSVMILTASPVLAYDQCPRPFDGQFYFSDGYNDDEAFAAGIASLSPDQLRDCILAYWQRKKEAAERDTEWMKQHSSRALVESEEGIRKWSK